jgi:hypothetical protein
VSPGREVAGDHRGLDGDGPCAAERVDEFTLGCPAAQENERRGEGFAKLSIADAVAVSRVC